MHEINENPAEPGPPPVTLPGHQPRVNPSAFRIRRMNRGIGPEAVERETVRTLADLLRTVDVFKPYHGPINATCFPL